MPFVITIIKNTHIQVTEDHRIEFIQITVVGALDDESVEFFFPFL